MNKEKWYNNSEYVSIVKDLLSTPSVQRLHEYTQHHHSDRLTHSIHVSYHSYLIAKKLGYDYKAAARGGLLHDLFYYDWRKTKFNLGTHAYMHPRIALHNARRITDLSPKEEDIIVKHMFGCTLERPKYIESYIVSFIDDYEAIADFFHPYKARMTSIIHH